MPMALLPPPTQAIDDVGQPADLLEHLAPRLAADHRLELAHHQRVGMRPERRAEHVGGVGDVGHPVAHRLVDGVLERLAARVHLDDRRAEQAHAHDVERLAAHVLGAHVDVALEAEQRARRGGGDAVLAGAGFGDDAALPHLPREQRLPERVVDLVRAGVREVLALEQDPHAGRAARLGREAARLVERRRPPDVGREQRRQLAAGSARRRGPPGSRRSAPRPARPASRARSARRTRRSSRAHPDRAARTPVSALPLSSPVLACPRRATCPTRPPYDSRAKACARAREELAPPCPDPSGRARPRRPTTRPRRTGARSQSPRPRCPASARRPARPSAAARSPPPAASRRACRCRRAAAPDTASSSSVASASASDATSTPAARSSGIFSAAA